MNAPWRLALAPADFDKLSNRVLVGQFGSGEIAIFDPENGNFHGLTPGSHGQPLTIEGALGFGVRQRRRGGTDYVMFSAAGIDDEKHGLFGTITPIDQGANNG